MLSMRLINVRGEAVVGEGRYVVVVVVVIVVMPLIRWGEGQKVDKIWEEPEDYVGVGGCLFVCCKDRTLYSNVTL